jgi:hypothetical protein
VTRLRIGLLLAPGERPDETHARIERLERARRHAHDGERLAADPCGLADHRRVFLKLAHPE